MVAEVAVALVIEVAGDAGGGQVEEGHERWGVLVRRERTASPASQQVLNAMTQGQAGRVLRWRTKSQGNSGTMSGRHWIWPAMECPIGQDSSPSTDLLLAPFLVFTHLKVSLEKRLL